MTHFKSLVVGFMGIRYFSQSVVLNKTDKYTEKEIQDKYDLKIPVSFDPSIANACGVYSTPQAVLLDRQHKLYYRGNYNRSRYCTDVRTNYAQMAIDTLLANNSLPLFDASAFRSYGCQLPNCKK